MKSATLKLRHRVYELDLLRFIALMMVVLFHFTARKYSLNPLNETHHFYWLTEVSRLGHLGVNLFFIISGFVIIASAANKQALDFLTARIVRLYPAFWAGVLLSAIFLLGFGYPIDARAPDHIITIKQILYNLTMFSGYMGDDYIDIVYWSLQVEIKFYFLVLILIMLRQINNIEFGLWIWLALSIVLFHVPQDNLVLKILKSASIFPYSPYFIAGVMFFIIRQDRFNFQRLLLLIICCYLAVLQAEIQAKLYIHNATSTQILYSQIMVVCFFVLFAVLSAGRLQIKKSNIIFYLGALTYPMYLIHNMIGKVTYDFVVGYMSKYLALPFVIILMAGVSILIVILIENKLRRPLRDFLNGLAEKIRWLIFRKKA